MSIEHVIAGLRQLYPAPGWALFTEVRSATGTCDVLRYADAVAVDLWPRGPGWRLFGFEVKVSRADWLRERKRPEKSAPIKLFCAAWYLVTPAPWKNVVINLHELPERWGLIEIGTGRANIVRLAEERDAEEPTPGFVRALLRAAAHDDAAAAEGDDDQAPLVEINRPRLSRSHVGLLCGHVAPRPLAKTQPRRLPCFGCAEGRPTDRQLIEAAIDEASNEDLRALAARIEARRKTVLSCSA